MKKLNIVICVITTIIASSNINAFKDLRPYFQGNGRDEQGQNMLHRAAAECEVAEAFDKAKDDFMTEHFNDTKTITIQLTIDAFVEMFEQEDENGETPFDILSRKIHETRCPSCEKTFARLFRDKKNMQNLKKNGEGKKVLIGKNDN